MAMFQEVDKEKRKVLIWRGDDDVTCHQCQCRENVGRLVRCSTCRTKLYCVLCVEQNYPLSEAEVAVKCPFCRNICSCIGCLLKKELTKKRRRENPLPSNNSRKDLAGTSTNSLLFDTALLGNPHERYSWVKDLLNGPDGKAMDDPDSALLQFETLRDGMSSILEMTYFFEKYNATLLDQKHISDMEAECGEAKAHKDSYFNIVGLATVACQKAVKEKEAAVKAAKKAYIEALQVKEKGENLSADLSAAVAARDLAVAEATDVKARLEEAERNMEELLATAMFWNRNYEKGFETGYDKGFETGFQNGLASAARKSNKSQSVPATSAEGSTVSDAEVKVPKAEASDA